MSQPEVVFLDLISDEFTARFLTAPLYIKKSDAQVTVRRLTDPELVVTILADGTQETVNHALPGYYEVTGAGGEKFALQPEVFSQRFRPTDHPGTYRAIGLARAFPNPTGHPIEIMAPWGEKQYGGTLCMLAAIYDPDHPDQLSADRVIVGATEFTNTYDPYPPQTPSCSAARGGSVFRVPIN